VQHEWSAHWCPIPTALALTRLWCHTATPLCRNQGCVQGIWGLNLIQFLWPTLRKVTQNYEYKARHVIQCSLTKRKQITTNYKFKIVNKYHKYNKIRNNNTVCSLNNFLTHFCSTSFLHSLSACPLIASSYDNDFVISFPVEWIKRQFSLFSSLVVFCCWWFRKVSFGFTILHL